MKGAFVRSWKSNIRIRTENPPPPIWYKRELPKPLNYLIGIMGFFGIIIPLVVILGTLGIDNQLIYFFIGMPLGAYFHGRATP
jgi:hypothetical protein